MARYVPEPEKSLGIMICGHGKFLTKDNGGVWIEVPIVIPKSTIYTFAAAGEASCYPPDSLMNLTKAMKKEFSDKKDINDEIFLEKAVELQKLKEIKMDGMVYESPKWSSAWSRKPGFTGNKQRSTTKYHEKGFVNADEMGGGMRSGVYVFYKENAFISDFYPIEYDGFQPWVEDGNYIISLTNILSFFVNDYKIRKFYIFDATCSVIHIPGQTPTGFPESRTEKIASYHIQGLINSSRKGGRSKTKRSKTKKSKKKRNKKHIY